MARAIHVFRTPDRFVAGTVGQPGNRTFYIQAVGDSRVVSVILEKQQVAVLAERIGALLLEVNRRFGTPVPPEPAEITRLERVANCRADSGVKNTRTASGPSSVSSSTTEASNSASVTASNSTTTV